MKVIIALVGPFKSGKTTVAEYLEEKYQAVNLRFSKFLSDILKECYCLDSESRENLQKISTALRKGFGDDILGRIVHSFVYQSTNNIFVLDGVRRMGDIEYLRKMPGFGLVSIDADIKVRWERAKKQGDKSGDKQKNFAEFVAEEAKEADARIRDVMMEADFQIDTTSIKKEEHYQKWDNEILPEIKRRLK